MAESTQSSAAVNTARLEQIREVPPQSIDPDLNNTEESTSKVLHIIPDREEAAVPVSVHENIFHRGACLPDSVAPLIHKQAADYSSTEHVQSDNEENSKGATRLPIIIQPETAQPWSETVNHAALVHGLKKEIIGAVESGVQVEDEETMNEAETMPYTLIKTESKEEEDSYRHQDEASEETDSATEDEMPARAEPDSDYVPSDNADQTVNKKKQQVKTTRKASDGVFNLIKYNLIKREKEDSDVESEVRTAGHSNELSYKPVYKRKTDLEIASATTKIVRKIECSICFKRVKDLRSHYSKHTGEKSFKCSQCGRKFADRNVYRRHVTTAHREKTSTHAAQTVDFAAELDMRIHAPNVEKGSQKTPSNKEKDDKKPPAPRKERVKPTVEKVPCEVCGKILASKNRLKRHLTMHENLECLECGKTFLWPYRLKEHVLKHGAKRFICEVCGNGFHTEPSLKLHLLVHTGEKAFVCAQCGKAFRTKEQRKIHSRTHTGEQPYECKECGRKFSAHSRLHRHQMIHTGVKPHVCELCGKAFNQRFNLTVHRRSHERGTL